MVVHKKLNFVLISTLFAILVALFVSLTNYYPSEELETHETVILSMTQHHVNALVYIAQKYDFFKKHKINVEMEFFRTGREAFRHTLRKKSQLALVADTPIVFAMLQNHRFNIYATIASTKKGMGIVLKDDHSGEMPKLKGKSIGYSKGTNQEYFLNAFLMKYGLTSKDVRLKNMKPEEMIEAFKTGKISLATAWQPLLDEIAKAQPKSQTISAPEIYTWTWNLVGHRSTKSSSVTKFLKALVDAENFLNEHPDDGYEVIMEALGLDIKNPVPQYIKDTEFRVELSQSLIVNLESQIDMFKSSSVVEPNILHYLDWTPLESVKPPAVEIIR